MGRYILTRLLQTIPVLLVSSVAIFLIVHLVPGDPALVVAGPDATPDVVEAVRARLGLDRPLPVQYFTWLRDALMGDFGTSYVNRLPASELIALRLAPTLQLAVAGIVVALSIGIPLGLLAAIKRGTWIDLGVSMGSAGAIAMPNFWFGILLLLLFSLQLGWLPAGGRVPFSQDPIMALQFIALPAFALGLNAIAVLARYSRSATLDVLGSNHIRTARSKGVGGRRIITKHVIRNAMIPVVTITGIVFGRMVGGAVVIESVFGWPGLGRLLVQSISNRDYTIVQGTLLLLVVFFVVINLCVDLLYGVIDPRIRVGSRKATR